MNRLPFPLTEWLVLSFRAPRRMARTLIDLDLPNEAMWQALVLFTVLSTLVLGLPEALAPSAPSVPAVLRHPLLLAAVNLGLSVAGVWGLAWTGRLFGGQAQPRDILPLSAWFQLLQFVLLLAILVLGLALPALAALVALAASIASLWILLNFIDEAHGFGNLGLAFLTFASWILAFSLVVAVLLRILGLGPAGGIAAGGLANV